MNKLLGTAIMAATFSVGASTALAADMAHENRAVTAQVTKVRLDGVVDLRIKQGSTASLVVWGDPADLAKLTTTQDGNLLRIDTAHHEFHWGRESHKLRADLTVPNLEEFVSQGVGGADVSGFTGNAIKVSLDGAGGLTMNSRYRNLDAHLGGVGAMTINGVDANQVDLSLSGAGHINVNGKAKQLHAHLGGVGSLDAQALQADAVDLDISGLGGAKVYAKTSAAVALSGLGSATVYGRPATRSSNSSGLGHVSWQ